jgi:hypothetical protein
LKKALVQVVYCMFKKIPPKYQQDRQNYVKFYLGNFSFI